MCMSPALDRSSVIQCFEHGDAIEIRDRELSAQGCPCDCLQTTKPSLLLLWNACDWSQVLFIHQISFTGKLQRCRLLLKKKLQTHMLVSNELQHLQSESNQLYLGHSYSSLGLLQFQYMPHYPNELVHFQYQTKQMSRQQHLKITKQTNNNYIYTPQCNWNKWQRTLCPGLPHVLVGVDLPWEEG